MTNTKKKTPNELHLAGVESETPEEETNMDSVTNTLNDDSPTAASFVRIMAAGHQPTAEIVDGGGGIYQAMISAEEARALVMVEWDAAEQTWLVYVDDGDGRLTPIEARQFACDLTAASNLADILNVADQKLAS